MILAAACRCQDSHMFALAETLIGMNDASIVFQTIDFTVFKTRVKTVNFGEFTIRAIFSGNACETILITTGDADKAILDISRHNFGWNITFFNSKHMVMVADLL
jgi:hypothetical protein